MPATTAVEVASSRPLDPRMCRPGASSRYGVSCRCRWRKPTGALPGDEVLPGGEVLLVVQRFRVEDLDLRKHLLCRENERVLRDRRVVLLRPPARSRHGRDVVD